VKIFVDTKTNPTQYLVAALLFMQGIGQLGEFGPTNPTFKGEGPEEKQHASKEESSQEKSEKEVS